MRVARVWYALEQLAHLDPRLEASAAPAPAAAHKPKPIAPRKGGAVGAAVAAAAAEQPAAAGIMGMGTFNLVLGMGTQFYPVHGWDNQCTIDIWANH